MTPTLAPDTRQIARVYTIPADLVHLTHWQKIGSDACALAASFEAVRQPDGGITVTIFWPKDTP